MITALNQFETIPAFEIITSRLDSQRAIACDLIKALQRASSFDCSQLWQDIATTNDNDQYLIDIQADIAQTIQDNCPLPDYCTIELQDSEWRVVPYIDTDLPHLSHNPCYVTQPCEFDGHKAYDIIVVNDHGNTDLMQWNDQKREYITTWAMV